jgi:hypothetical protein
MARFSCCIPSTASTYAQLANPWAAGPRGLLFWAAVPVLAAALALFLLIDRDRLLSVDAAGWARRLRQ